MSTRLKVTATISGAATSFLGTVAFFENGVQFKLAPVSGAGVTLPVAIVPAGHESLTARYSGDATDAASTSPAVAIVRYYDDIPPSSPDYATSLFAADHNLFDYTPDGTFGPTVNVTKQYAAEALFRYAEPGRTPEPCTSNPFSDVAASSTQCPYVQWLAKAGGAPGGPSGAFHPLDLVMRGELASEIYAVVNNGAADPGCHHAPSNDVATSVANCGAIAWAIAQGVLPTTSGVFDPSGEVSRLDLTHALQNLDTALHRTMYVLLQTGSAPSSQLVPVNLGNGTVGAPMPGVPNTANAAAVTSDGKTVYVAGSAEVDEEFEGYLEPVSLSTGTVGTPLQTGGFLPYSQLALSNDNSKIYGNYNYMAEGRIDSYATSTPGVLASFLGGGNTNSLVSAPNGPMAAFEAAQYSSRTSTVDTEVINTATNTLLPKQASSLRDVFVTLSVGYVYNGPVASDDITPVNLATGAFGVRTQVPGGGITQLLIAGPAGGSIGYTLSTDNALRGVDLASHFVSAPLGLPGTVNSMVIPVPGTFAYVDVTVSGSHEIVPVNLITMSEGIPIPLHAPVVYGLLPAQRTTA